MFPLEELAKTMCDQQFDSVFLIANSPPVFTKHGAPVSIDSMEPLSANDIASFQRMLSLEYSGAIGTSRLSESDFDFSIGLKDYGRYRVQGYIQRGSYVYSIKRVGGDIPTLEHCRVPVNIQEAILADKGLILLSGASISDLHAAQASLVKHRSVEKNRLYCYD